MPSLTTEAFWYIMFFCFSFCVVVGEFQCFVFLFYAGKIKVWWENCVYLPERWGEEILVRTCHWRKKFVSCNGIYCELQKALSYKCCYVFCMYTYCCDCFHFYFGHWKRAVNVVITLKLLCWAINFVIHCCLWIERLSYILKSEFVS